MTLLTHNAIPTAGESQETINPKRSAATLALLTLGFGLVGLDRFMIFPMFPVIAGPLHLDYQDIGLIAGALSISWGLASIFVGNLADLFGPRRVAVVALVGFSLVVGISGLAAGLVSLVALRAIVGLLEGAFAPAALVANFETSSPAHIGRNVGIMQAAMPLFGLALAPLIVTHLVSFIDWRYVFILLLPPGLCIAWLLWKVLGKATGLTADRIRHGDESPFRRWREALAISNVRVTSLCICCWIACLVVISALLPSYMTDYLHLSIVQMGGVLSAIGLGATLGGLIMPALSDKIGRKPVALIDALGTILFLLYLIDCGADTTKLFVALFGAAFFLYNLLGMTLSTMTAESVPEHVRTTAAGLVTGIGELFGAGIFPIIAGHILKIYGISYVPEIAILAMVLGTTVLTFYRETHRGQR
jgi:MFS family permease